MISYTIDRMLEIFGEGAECVGAFDGAVSGIASLSDAAAGELSFLGNTKYRSQVADSQASVILLPKDYVGEPQPAQLYIRLEHPSLALALLCRDIEQTLHPRPPAGIHPTASIDPTAGVDASASIGAFCYIAAGAQIGANCVWKIMFPLVARLSLSRNAIYIRRSQLRIVVSLASATACWQAA